MARKGTIVVKECSWGKYRYVVEVPASLSPDGKRKRHFCMSRQEGRAKKEEIQIELDQCAITGANLGDTQLAIQASNLLRGSGINILELAQEALDKQRALGRAGELLPAANKYLKLIEADNPTRKHVRAIERSLERLVVHGPDMLYDCSPEWITAYIESWFKEEPDWGNGTRVNQRGFLSGFLKWAVQTGLIGNLRVAAGLVANVKTVRISSNGRVRSFFSNRPDRISTQ